MSVLFDNLRNIAHDKKKRNEDQDPMKYRRNHRLLDRVDMTFSCYVISFCYKIYIGVNLFGFVKFLIQSDPRESDIF